jgi:hypothetical protein
VGEAVDVGELGRVVSDVDEHRKRSPGFDGLELCPVADEQHLRADFGGVVGDPVKAEGSGKRASSMMTSWPRWKQEPPRRC